MMLFFHKLASPKYFYNFAGRLIPWLAWACLLFFITGLYYGLVKAPPDYQQGDSYRIMFIHVPAAWMSMFVYVVMAGAGIIGLVFSRWSPARSGASRCGGPGGCGMRA